MQNKQNNPLLTSNQAVPNLKCASIINLQGGFRQATLLVSALHLQTRKNMDLPCMVVSDYLCTYSGLCYIWESLEFTSECYLKYA